jgi:hypothetical protein
MDSLPSFQHKGGGAVERTGPEYINHYLHEYYKSPVMERRVTCTTISGL